MKKKIIIRALLTYVILFLDLISNECLISNEIINHLNHLESNISTISTIELNSMTYNNQENRIVEGEIY